jgi:alpha 1,2-mannosyltransferase
MTVHVKRKNVFILLLLSITLMISIFLWKQQRPPNNFQESAESQLTTTIDRYKEKAKGCFVILIRNNELDGIASTMTQIEETFNGRYDYPYVFINNEAFTSDFKTTVESLTNARVLFGTLDDEQWGYPSFINQTYAAERREELVKQNVAYGGSESYRHMCRYSSQISMKFIQRATQELGVSNIT